MADAETEHQKARPCADHPRAILIRNRLGHGGKRARNRERGAEPLQGPGRDSNGSGRGQCDDKRGQSEQRNARGGGATRPKCVGRLAAQHDEHRGGQQIGIDRPFYSCGTKVEALRHRGQRRHDRRAVFPDRQHCETTGTQHQAGVLLAKFLNHG